MSLLFVRHGETWANASGDYSTADGDLLSDRGLEQAECLVAALGRMPAPGRIVISPMTRALQTIRPYLLSTGQRAEVWPELAEGCWQTPESGEASDWPAEPHTIPSGFEGLFHFRGGESLHPCGSETYLQGRFRARCALKLLRPLALADAGDTLIVTHGHMLREMLNAILEARALVRFPHDNCGMTRVSWNERWMIEYVNRPLEGA